MFSGQFVLSQLLDFIHPQQFRRCVERYGGDYKVQHFTCWQQFVCLVFAQLTWRESLRDIESCLNARTGQLYHLGLRAPVKRSTLADALATRDWRIFADLAQQLIAQARSLYAAQPLAQLWIRVGSSGRPHHRDHEARERPQASGDHDRRAGGLDALDDVGDELVVGHVPMVPCPGPG